MSLKRLIAFTALGVLALSVGVAHATHGTGGPPSTQPNGTDDSYGEAACVLSAGAVAGTAASAGGGGVQSLARDAHANNGGPVVVNDTDGGTFQFSGSATCTGEDTAGTSVGTTGAVSVTITAQGRYTNLVCGTGSADGSAHVGGSGIDLTTHFGINFVAGNGKLVTSHADGVVTIGNTTNDVDDGSGDGFINIVPSAGNSCVQDDDPTTTDEFDDGVESFNVSGAFDSSLSGDAQGNNKP